MGKFTIPSIYFRHGVNKNIDINKTEITVNKIWDISERAPTNFTFEPGTNDRGMPLHKLRFTGPSVYIDGIRYPGHGQSMNFPFEPEKESANIRVSIHPSVSLSEFNIPLIQKPLPRFFGTAELAPLEREFEVVIPDEDDKEMNCPA